MDYKRRLIFLGTLALAGLLIASVLLWPDRLGLCSHGDKACIYNYINYEIISVPILLFSLLTLVCSVVLYFMRSGVFYSWVKFTLWWVPLSVILIAITPEYGGSGLDGGIPSFGREVVIWFMAGGFFVLSLLIIAWKSFRLRKKEKSI
ncbi:MAG TPA: hypothetical protein VI981_00260 [Candidatus Paceibacterota bacterium]